MPKVSVIVPVYGVEAYIERCARSLFEQTLDDIEYLFIDDCTPDHSIEILKYVLEDYPQRKPQVSIHRMEQNSGQAKVREWGIRNAVGEYVIHCDSDDWVEKEMYRAMYEKAINENADIVRCNFVRTNGVKEKLCYQVPSSSYRDKYKILSYMLMGLSQTSLCDKLVKKSIYDNNKIIYPHNNMQEDAVITFQLVYYANKIEYLPTPYYKYCENPQSITRQNSYESFSKRLNDVINNNEIILLFLKNNNLEEMFVEEIICRKYIVRSHINILTNKTEFRRLWWSVYPEIDGHILTCKKMRTMDKVYYYSVKLHVYPLVYRLIKMIH